MLSIFAVSGGGITAESVLSLLRKTDKGKQLIQRLKELHPKSYHKRLADRVRTEKKKRKQLNSSMILSGYALISHANVIRLLLYLYFRRQGTTVNQLMGERTVARYDYELLFQ
jgi:hypothetical protein